MTSAFDPNSFLDAQISAPMVRRPNIPAGTEVIGSVVEVTPRQWTSKEDPSKTGMAMDLQIDLDLTTVPGLAEKIGQTKVRVKDGIMLDLTDNGAIDVGAGKNGKLRRYREAYPARRELTGARLRLDEPRPALRAALEALGAAVGAAGDNPHQPGLAAVKIKPRVELKVDQVHIGGDLVLQRALRIELNHLRKGTTRALGN